MRLPHALNFALKHHRSHYSPCPLLLLLFSFSTKRNHNIARLFISTQASSFTKMASSSPEGRSYADAIGKLNSFQSNFATLEVIRKKIREASERGQMDNPMPETIEWFKRIGYEPKDFDRLNIIHVAGTKGKGSTCAFATSILKQYKASGLQFPTKIGLYTSPHLKAVRERIQIDGKPIPEAMFAKYFFEIYDRVEKAMVEEKLEAETRPAYFRFLTMLAMHVFIKENVDTLVLEVGMGGEFDSTNVVVNPTVTGVSSLGIDHVGVLGDTIEQIAWQKAGIFKNGAKAFTVEQVSGAMGVLQKRAEEKKTTLEVVSIHPDIRGIKLGLAGEFQKSNAALATAMVAEHMKRCGHPGVDASPEIPFDDNIKRGLEKAIWPGRCQVKNEGNVQWCIDGAHTKESVEAAAGWFASIVNEDKTPKRRALLFNQQTRDAPALIRYLHDVISMKVGQDHLFDHVIFCTNNPYKDARVDPDHVNNNANTQAVKELTVQKGLAEAWAGLDPKSKIHVLPSIEEGVDLIRGLESEVQVFVAGSLHLVGAFLQVVEKDEDMWESE